VLVAWNVCPDFRVFCVEARTVTVQGKIVEWVVISLVGTVVLLLVQWCIALARDWHTLCGDWYGLYRDWHCAKLCEDLNLQSIGAPTRGWRPVTSGERCKVTATPCSQREVHCLDCHWALLRDAGSPSSHLESYWLTADTESETASPFKKAS